MSVTMNRTEAAEYLGVSKSQLRQLVKSGGLRSYRRDDGSEFFYRAILDAHRAWSFRLLDSQVVKAKAERSKARRLPGDRRGATSGRQHCPPWGCRTSRPVEDDDDDYVNDLSIPDEALNDEDVEKRYRGIVSKGMGRTSWAEQIKASLRRKREKAALAEYAEQLKELGKMAKAVLGVQL